MYDALLKNIINNEREIINDRHAVDTLVFTDVIDFDTDNIETISTVSKTRVSTACLSLIIYLSVIIFIFSKSASYI